MACNQVNILNYNHNLVEVTSGDNFLVITDNNACTSITIPQPVTNIIQVNTPGPQGPGGFPYTGSALISGSLTITGSLNVTGGITGSLQGTASWAINAITASYVQNAQTASYVLNAISASFATTASYALNAKSVESITGSRFFIPVFNTTSSLVTSSIYDSGSFTAIGATAPVNPSNPDRLFIDAGDSTSYNLLSGHGDVNNYLQLNVQNFSAGATASSDIVATANNGDESNYYVDLGINGSGYNITNGVGQANDAYLFNTGGDLLLGNASTNKRVIIFNGGTPALDNARVYITQQGTVGINASDTNNNNPEALLIEPLPGNPSNTFSNLIIGRGTIHESYLQFNLINKGTGSYASADIVASNDISTETSNYIDMGINSSNHVVDTTFAPGGPNDSYLLSTARDLLIGSSTSGSIILWTGTDFNDKAGAKLILRNNNRHSLTGSLSATQGFTGSLLGTASFAISASWAPSIGGSGFPFSGSAVITGSLLVSGSGLTVTGSLGVLGSVNASSFTGSLLGTATTASFVITAQTASYVLTAQTASYVQNAQTASYVLTAQTASFITSSNVFGPYGANSVLSASYALSSSIATNATNATNASTASYVAAANVVGTVTSASHADQANNAATANFASTAGNGGVTNIVAGSGITLIPTSGVGAVTVISSGGGGVTIISGSNVTQSFSNSATWTFNHNLGTRTPIITVFDTNYKQIIPQDIELASTSSTTITFPTAESGFAVASLGGATGNVLSSSYSLFSTYADTASAYAETDPVFTAKSSSLVTTASFNSFTASYKTDSSSFNNKISSLTNATSSYVLTSVTASMLSPYILTSVTSSMTVLSSSFARTASFYIETDPVFIAKSASLATTGSNTFIGNQIITGSLIVSGSSTFTNIGPAVFSGSVSMSAGLNINGNIIPSVSKSFSLGSTEFPFRDVFISSGSLIIASDSPGAPSTTLSNIDGNILISAGGMQLVGSGSFNAATGSFEYISGSLTQVGTVTRIGNTISTGSWNNSGSFTLRGPSTFSGSIQISGSLTVTQGITSSLFGTASYAQTASYINPLNQNVVITGSLLVSGSITHTGSFLVTGSTTQIGNNTLIGNTSLTGSITISGSQTFIGTSTNIGTVTQTGSFLVTGSTTHVGSVTVTGSVNINGSIIMDGTAQSLLLRASAVNPSALSIFAFPTGSYHGASFMFSAIEDSTGKTTTYNVLVAQGNNKVAEIKTYLIKSEGSAPTPTIATALNAGNVELRVTDTGTFTYRGIVQLF